MFRASAISAGLVTIAFAVSACPGTDTRSPGPAAIVTSVVPADGAAGVSLASTITVAFDREMSGVSVSTATECIGSVQVSADDFATCVAFCEEPETADGLSFELTPAEQLAPSTTYRVRVTRDPSPVGGGETEPFAMTDGFTTTTAPVVLATTPADGALALASSGLSITFDREMDASTITGNTSSTACTGAVQLSTSSAFTTCLELAAQPSSTDDVTFTFEAELPLRATAEHYVRVTRAAAAADGSALASVFTSGGWTTRYAHTIAIDGVNDFAADERFTTSTGSPFFGYLGWDVTHLYVGIEGPDVGTTSGPTKFLLIYLGGPDGTTTGQTYNTQTPGLPFEAKWHVRWRTDEGFLGVQEFGTSWTDDGWTPSTFNAGDYVEMAIPLAELGNPTSIPIVFALINEQGGAEFTFSGVPSTAFADAFDPDYAAFFEVDLSGSVTPSQLVPE